LIENLLVTADGGAAAAAAQAPALVLATKTTAQLLGLGFVSLRRERFDVLILKDRFFGPNIQLLLDIIGSGEFRDRVEAMGGYDVSESGRVISSKHH